MGLATLFANTRSIWKKTNELADIQDLQARLDLALSALEDFHVYETEVMTIPDRPFRRDLCDSAKKGKFCIDDLCHTGGETLCGFCKFDYDEMTDEEREPIQEDYNDTLEDVDRYNRETGGGYW